MSEQIQVMVRFRPENEKEKAKGGKPCATVPDYSDQECRIDCSAQGFGEKTFTFDRVFGFDSTQEEVYNVVGLPIVEGVLSGYNGTVLAYGQTSSGKTHTMMGPEGGNTDSLTSGTALFKQRGLIPRIISALFDHLAKLNTQEIQWGVRVSNFELYKEQIRDLLNIEMPPGEFRIREDTISGKGIYVENLTEVEVANTDEILQTIKQGTSLRKVAATQANDTSSRSHSIVQLCVEQINLIQNGTRTIGRLNLVDLAGSEKVAKTGAEGERLKEAQAINLSLTLLGQVIYKLTDGHSVHIPYRDSKLTRILQDSFGGNSRTLLLCACSPSSFNQLETVSTLQFASRAKQIKNKPRINKEMNLSELNIAYARAQEQIRVLKDRISELEDDLHNNNNSKSKTVAGSGIRAASSLARSSAGTPSDDQQSKIEELESIIRSLKEELQELRSELIERTAEISTLKATVDFWQKKFNDMESKHNDIKEKFNREKMACQTWMRKAQEVSIQQATAKAKEKSNGTTLSKVPSVRRGSVVAKKPKKKASKPKLKDDKEKDPEPDPADDLPELSTPSPSGEPMSDPTTDETSTKDDNMELLQAYQALQQAEEATQKRLEAMENELNAAKQRLIHADKQNQEYGKQRAVFAGDMEAKNLEIEKLMKDLDLQRRGNSSKDSELAELKSELEKQRFMIQQSHLSVDEKERILGLTQDAYDALQGENAHLAELAKQLGREANQREICEIVSIDLMVKGEDLSALDNEVYLLEMFDGSMDDANTTLSKSNTRTTLKELKGYLEHVKDILSAEAFANPSTESQRITLLFQMSEMTSKVDELVRRLKSL